MKSIRIGVIGCGKISRIAHLPHFAAHPDCIITAVADPDEKYLATAQRKYRVPYAFRDPSDLLRNAPVDAVVIGSPNWAHATQVIEAAERGLHVLCEKPLATNLADCERMIEACTKAGVTLQVALQKRFHPAFQRAREMIEAGELGEVFQISVDWNHYIPDLETSWLKKTIGVLARHGVDVLKDWGAWRLNDPRAGGGDFMDHGPHFLDLFRFLLGDFDLVSAEMKRVFPSRVHEDHALCTVRFKSGALGHIERSQNVVSRPYGHETGAIHGTRGSLYFDAPHEYTQGHVRLYRYRMRNIILDRRSRIHVPGGKRNRAYQKQAGLFAARLAGHESDQTGFPAAWAPTGEDGLLAVEAVLAAYLSSHEERKIAFPLTAEDRRLVEAIKSYI
ncbi:MAG TPA: Gfo/Idh/MocA family oxidoreductase [bacterium]|nr:Gfo/Idh/MocA family oxidoreductase [bacterium]